MLITQFRFCKLEFLILFSVFCLYSGLDKMAFFSVTPPPCESAFGSSHLTHDTKKMGYYATCDLVHELELLLYHCFGVSAAVRKSF